MIKADIHNLNAARAALRSAREQAASTAAAAWSARTFSPLPALSPILEENPARRVKWAPEIEASD
jgi:hypothetical protein